MSAGLAVAALVTLTGVAFLVVSDRRRTHRWSLLVLWTAVLALAVAAVFLVLGPVAWVVAAPGVLLWCAAAATGGRPGTLVDPPPAGDPSTTSRRARRAERRHGRTTTRFLLLVLAAGLVVAALAWAASSGHLPWTS